MEGEGAKGRGDLLASGGEEMNWVPSEAATSRSIASYDLLRTPPSKDDGRGRKIIRLYFILDK